MIDVIQQLAKAPIPLLPNRVWRFYLGGKLIDELRGIAPAKDADLPEEWVGSCVEARNPPGHQTPQEGLQRVKTPSGELAFLRALVEADPKAMLGERHVARWGNNPALLVKLLDTQIRLFVHVHPTREFATKHLNSCFGKTEGWIITQTRQTGPEPPSVWLGFRQGIRKEQFKAWTRKQDVPAMLAALHKLPAKPGDVFYIQAGLPHAIGAGIFCVELQEPTDFSICAEKRCLDFEFASEKDQFGGMDFDLAMDTFDYTGYTPRELEDRFVLPTRTLRAEGPNREEQLFGGPRTKDFFAAHRLTVATRMAPGPRGGFCILVLLDGAGRIRSAAGTWPVKRGDPFFLPAALNDWELEAEAGRPITAISCLPPAGSAT